MMQTNATRLSALIEKVGKARTPSRMLFGEAWFAITSKQEADAKVQFAFFMQSNAWMDAALLMVAHALPDWGIVTRSGPGPGEARLQPPWVDRTKRPAELGAVRHPGGAALAILQAVLHAKAGGF